MMNNTRYEYIDYAKALIMILVVLVHSGFSMMNPVGNVLMLVFFVCSGFTSSAKTKPFSEILRSKFQKILLPYWVATALYAVFEIWRAYYFGYGDYKILYPSIVSMLYGSSAKVPYIPGVTRLIAEATPFTVQPQDFMNVILPTNCHLWFLPAMFTGIVLFNLYTRYVKQRRSLDAALIMILLVLAYSESLPYFPQFPYGLGRGFLACACMIAGRYLRYYDVFSLNVKGYVLFAVSFIAACASFYLEAGTSKLICSIYPFGNVHGVFLLFTCGISMSISLLFLCKIIGKKIQCRGLSAIGKNTMTIYLWHMVFLTFFGAVMLRILGLPVGMDKFCMAFISDDCAELRVLVSALSIGMCMLVATMKNQKKKLAYALSFALCLAVLTLTGNV